MICQKSESTHITHLWEPPHTLHYLQDEVQSLLQTFENLYVLHRSLFFPASFLFTIVFALNTTYGTLTTLISPLWPFLSYPIFLLIVVLQLNILHLYLFADSWGWLLFTWHKEPTHRKRLWLLGNIDGRRRVRQCIRWLDSHVTDSMDMSLRKLWKMIKDREAWHTAVHGAAKSWTRLSNWATTRSPSGLNFDETIRFSRKIAWLLNPEQEWLLYALIISYAFNFSDSSPWTVTTY